MSKFRAALYSGKSVRRITFTDKLLPGVKVVVKLDENGKVVSCKAVKKK